MTIGEILKRFIDDSPMQFLHECLLGATAVNGSGSRGRKKGHQRYTRVTFATDKMTPDDAMWFTGQLGRSDERKPKYIGIVVWVPTKDYESATAADAVDPVDASSREPSTRVKEKD